MMKDVTDPSLLENASTSEVLALRQAASRAKAMARGKNGEAAGAQRPTSADNEVHRTFKEFEMELDSGAWSDEKPTSVEEVELPLSHERMRLFACCTDTHA